VWKLSFPEWIYVPLIIVGVFAGLFSMVKFLVYTLKTFEKIEEEQNSARDWRYKSDE
jgi:hypothetical protein